MEEPKSIKSEDIFSGLDDRHRQDLQEGDLSERIWQYSRYIEVSLPVLSLNLNEFEVDEQTVAEYAARIEAGEVPPPGIWDPVNGSMIDGLHRANALARCGYTEITIWSGDQSTYEPIVSDEEDATDDVGYAP